MKTTKLFRILVAVTVLVSIIAVCCNISFAEGGNAPTRALPAPTAGSKNIPPASDISTDPYIATASSDGGKTGQMLAAVSDDAFIHGNSSISRLSSSSCRIWGDTGCWPSDPAVRVILKLQCYYDGSWHTMATISNSANGTYVQHSQVYNVTPGYYYRTFGTHTSMNAGSCSTCTNGMYIG